MQITSPPRCRPFLHAVTRLAMRTGPPCSIPLAGGDRVSSPALTCPCLARTSKTRPATKARMHLADRSPLGSGVRILREQSLAQLNAYDRRVYLESGRIQLVRDSRNRSCFSRRPVLSAACWRPTRSSGLLELAATRCDIERRRSVCNRSCRPTPLGSMRLHSLNCRCCAFLLSPTARDSEKTRGTASAWRPGGLQHAERQSSKGDARPAHLRLVRDALTSRKKLYAPSVPVHLS